MKYLFRIIACLFFVFLILLWFICDTIWHFRFRLKDFISEIEEVQDYVFTGKLKNP